MSPFDFSNDISHNKKYLIETDVDENQYSPFLVNRALAIFPDTLFHVNEMNLNGHIDKKLQYDYLYFAIRQKKRYAKWPWKKQANSSDFDLVQSYYKYSAAKTRAALDVLTKEQLDIIRTKLNQGGVK